MTHIESRPSRSSPGTEYDFFVDCEVDGERVKALQQSLESRATNLSIHARDREAKKDECEFTTAYFIFSFFCFLFLLFFVVVFFLVLFLFMCLFVFVHYLFVCLLDLIPIFHFL